LQQAESDARRRGGVSTVEPSRLKELERENAELRRASQILRKGSANCDRAELDRRPQ